MDAWGWIGIYLVGFVLFQALLFRYFAGGRRFGGPTPETGDLSATGRGDADASTADGDRSGGATVRCPHCGASNGDDGTYTYCRRCLAPLD